jgi:hypothetical protein
MASQFAVLATPGKDGYFTDLTANPGVDLDYGAGAERDDETEDS